MIGSRGNTTGNSAEPTGKTVGAPPAGEHQIVLIGEYRFPDGDAAAVRTMSLARGFRELGLRVTVIGKGQPVPEHYSPADGCHVVEGVRYTTMRPAPVGTLQRIVEGYQRLRQFESALDAIDLDGCVAIVVNACDSARHVPLLRAFCTKRKIPLVADVCEWYDPRQMPGGWANPFYLVFNAVFHGVLPKVQNLITVSRLLENRFSKPGKNLVRIASPIDVSEIPHDDLTDPQRLVLLYAGSAGRKDLLAEILIALGGLSDAELRRLEFRLLGPTQADLVALLGNQAGLLDRLKDTVRPLGRVPRAQVLAALQQAHFSVLFRPALRYASAGFPSKVPESLAAGTPIILNLTGDLGEYLADETASIVATSPAPEHIAVALRRALALNASQLKAMRVAARDKAELHFDFRRSIPALRQLLGQLR